MVFVRLFRILIFAETFSAQVIVVIDTPTPPVGMTFDAEVVVRLHRQQAVAAVGFEDSLRHGDARGDSVALHVGDGDGHGSG